MAPPASPVVARWELALRLRERRIERGISVRDLSVHMDFKPSYWSMVQNEKTLLGQKKLDEVIEYFEFDDVEAAELRQLNIDARNRGWWEDLRTPIRNLERFLGLEQGAKSMRVFEGSVITGMLQTDRYARAIVGLHPAMGSIDVEPHVRLRQLRRRRLFEDDPLELVCVMSEAALVQQVGGVDVLAEQLQYLVDIEADPVTNIRFHVVPFAVTPGVMIQMTTVAIYGFESRYLPDAYVLEELGDMKQIDVSDHKKLSEYSLAFDQALELALSHENSMEVIASHAVGFQELGAAFLDRWH